VALISGNSELISRGWSALRPRSAAPHVWMAPAWQEEMQRAADAIDVPRRAAIQVDSVRSVGHQAAIGDEVASGVD
jgi:hypothetical protein